MKETPSNKMIGKTPNTKGGAKAGGKAEKQLGYEVKGKGEKKGKKGDEKTEEDVIVPEEKTEQAVQIISQQQSPEMLISQAITQGVPVETMERLLAMRRELKAEFAKEQFDKSMGAFQGGCPVIEKKKAGGKTKSGQVAYYYAPLESIVQQVKVLINQNGFSYMIKTETLGEKVKVYCIIKHVSGHSETTDIEVPLGARTGVMSAPQVVASALTFAKRYAFCNAFGILTGDQDNDAQDSLPQAKAKDPMQIATSMINRETDVGVLIEFEKRIGKSEAYNKDQKEDLTKLIRSRANQIESEQNA